MSDVEPLSDEQRISLLEGKVGKNRTVITIVALTMLVILSVSFTVLILKLLRVDEPGVSRDSFDEQVVIIQALRSDLEEQRKTITSLSLTYQASQAAIFQKTLIEQEQSYQEFLSALKLGMYDLAKMVQGSRTWLDVYNDKLNNAQHLSELREKDLKRLE
jgi:ABC-type anion transport system duplicated permease subunit